MGRPKKQLESDDYQAIEDMAKRGLREVDIARRLGMAINTWMRIKEEDQAALDAWEAGRGAEHAMLVGVLHRAAIHEKNTGAAMFLLKTRYGYREKDEIRPEENRVRVMFELPGSANPADYLRVIEGESRRLTDAGDSD